MFQIIIIMVILTVLYLTNKSERSALQNINETVYIKPPKEYIKYCIPHAPTPTHAGAQEECNPDEKGEYGKIQSEVKSTNKGVNQHLKDVTQKQQRCVTYGTSHLACK